MYLMTLDGSPEKGKSHVTQSLPPPPGQNTRMKKPALWTDVEQPLKYIIK